MSVVLDTRNAKLDGSVAYEVAFTADGESSVMAFVVRAGEYGTGRDAPNPLRVCTDRIRAGLSEAACLAATWGEGLDDIGDVTRGGALVYLQFRRLPGDSGPVALDGALGLISSGFGLWPITAIGSSVSAGSASGSQIAVVRAIGRSVSSGSAKAAQIAVARGIGTSVSKGTAAASEASSGPTPYYVLLESENIKSTTLSATKENNVNAFYYWVASGNVDVRLGSGDWSAAQSTSGVFEYKTFTRTAVGGETTVSFRNSGSGGALTFTFPGGMSLSAGQTVTFKLFLDDDAGDLYLHSSDLVGQTYVEVG